MVISDQNNKIGSFSLFLCQIQLVYDAVVVLLLPQRAQGESQKCKGPSRTEKNFLKQESVHEVPVVVILRIYNHCAWRENLNSQSMLWLPVSVDFAVDFDLIQ